MFVCLSLSAQLNLDPATVSYQVVDLNSGNIITERGGRQCATPASVTKIITTATALEMLGPDYRFETLIQHDGNYSGGVINGNLIIKGSGDPTLGSFHLGSPDVIKRWAAKLYGEGLRKVNGDVVADASCFDREPIPVHWTWEDMGNYYAAGTFGLAIFDNTMRITFQSGAAGSKPQLGSVFPNIPDLKIDNQLRVLNIAADSGYIYGMPYDNKRIVLGGIPANRDRYTLRGDIPNPPLLVAQLLSKALQELGVEVVGEPTDKVRSGSDRETLFVHSSMPLSDIIKMTNFKSNNQYAEHLFKRLALERYGEASNAKAAMVVKDFWAKQGVDVSALFLFDGSGLSPQNAYSAETLNGILRYMYQKSAYRDVFIQSLPRAGKEGTVAGFLAKTPLEGKVWMKSGSISRVQCYSGYYLDNGKAYAFTVDRKSVV